MVWAKSTLGLTQRAVFFLYSGGTAPDFHRIPLLSENQYSGKMLWKQGSCREKIPLEKEVTFLHLSNKLSEGYFNLQISNFHDTRYSYLTKYSIWDMLSKHFYGAVAEWFKAAVLKTVVLQGTGGSNPPCSESFFSRIQARKRGRAVIQRIANPSVLHRPGRFDSCRFRYKRL